MQHLDRRPVLVMGATGSVGRSVLEQLLGQDVAVRVSSRRPAAGLPDQVEARIADLDDAASLLDAFDGVRAVFLYAHPGSADRVIEAARARQVARIVLMSSGSVVHASSDGNAITEEHRTVEQAFAAAADIDVVPIRPLVLAANSLGWGHPIRAAGRVALYRPEAQTAPIHERDIAAVAVAALTDTAISPADAMLTGPDRLSQRAQVDLIAAAIDRPIAVDELDRSAALLHYGRFMPAEEAEAVLQFLDDAAGGGSPATDAVAGILGRPAIGFATWAAEHVDDFR